MPHAEVSVIIRAPWAGVARLSRDYHWWPRGFPATIRGVWLVRSEGGRTELEIEHRDGDGSSGSCSSRCAGLPRRMMLARDWPPWPIRHTMKRIVSGCVEFSTRGQTTDEEP
jgi:hypothetical protein